MTSKRWRIFGCTAIVLVVGVAILAAVVTFWNPFASNEVYATLGGREVVCSNSSTRGGVHFKQDGPNTATVRLGERTARVNADRVDLPTGQSIPIPPACKRIELREAPSRIVVLFDGVEPP